MRRNIYAHNLNVNLYLYLSFITVLSVIERPPIQARAEAKLASLTAAVEQVLRRTPVQQVGVAALAKEAGVSTAYLYTRFAGKQALIDHVLDEFLTQQKTSLELLLGQGRWSIGLQDRLRWLAGQMQDARRQHEGKIRALFDLVPDNNRWLSLTAADVVVDWLMDCRHEIRREDPRAAISTVLKLLTLGLQTAPLLKPGQPGADMDAEEMVSVAWSYLRYAQE